MASAVGTSLHAKVTGLLRDKIVDGHLRPGAPIVERELCEELGVSRTPLREALKVLASENLVHLYQGRGALVAPVSVETIDAKFEVLAALEGLAAELVCRHADDDALQSLARLHRTMDGRLAEGDREGYFGLNQGFHEAIVRVAGNAVLSDMHGALARHVRRARLEAVLQHVDLGASSAEHARIVESLLRRDAATARQLVESHTRHVGESVVAHFRSRMRRGA